MEGHELDGRIAFAQVVHVERLEGNAVDASALRSVATHLLVASAHDLAVEFVELHVHLVYVALVDGQNALNSR